MCVRLPGWDPAAQLSAPHGGTRDAHRLWGGRLFSELYELCTLMDSHLQELAAAVASPSRAEDPCLERTGDSPRPCHVYLRSGLLEGADADVGDTLI